MAGMRCAVCSSGYQARAMADRMLAEGMTLRAIARRIGASHESVRRHRDRCEPIFTPALPPAPEPINVARLLALAVEGLETNADIARKHRAKAPAVATRAANAVTVGAARLLAIAAEAEHWRKLDEKVARLQEAAVEARALPAAPPELAAESASAARGCRSARRADPGGIRG